MVPGMSEDACNSRGLRALRHEQVEPAEKQVSKTFVNNLAEDGELSTFDRYTLEQK